MTGCIHFSYLVCKQFVCLDSHTLFQLQENPSSSQYLPHMCDLEMFLHSRRPLPTSVNVIQAAKRVGGLGGSIEDGASRGDVDMRAIRAILKLYLLPLWCAAPLLVDSKSAATIITNPLPPPAGQQRQTNPVQLLLHTDAWPWQLMLLKGMESRGS